MDAPTAYEGRDMTLFCHICKTVVSGDGISATCPHGPMPEGGTSNPVEGTITDTTGK